MWYVIKPILPFEIFEITAVETSKSLKMCNIRKKLEKGLKPDIFGKLI